ncbi:MAG: HI0074 family nucleotidyltransferase substrate-binding subunit [Candidatus Eisenbacteria bacterium]|nr:HI0074 family nucleotidyltransferase substrate-binding subunit [Candidatus Eisenbacteria bacterium]
MLDVTSLEKALGQLETSLRYLRSKASLADAELHGQFRAATIQGFEFTYELAAKFIRRQLEMIALSPGGLREINFSDLMRRAAEAGLVSDPVAFQDYRERRNMTSHAYEEEKAQEALVGIDDFVRDVHFLLDRLRARHNDGH